MLTRRTRYGWLTLGTLLCLLAIGLTCKLRDSNRACAQSSEVPVPVPPPPVAEKKDDKKAEKTSEPPLAEPRPLPKLDSTPATMPMPEVKPAVSEGPAKGPGEPAPVVIPASASVPVPPPGVPAPGSAPTEPMSKPAPPPATVAPPTSPPPAPSGDAIPPTTPPPSSSTLPPIKPPEVRVESVPPSPPVVKVEKTELQPVRALPALRSQPTAKAKVVLPLTGTYPVKMDDGKALQLPGEIVEQLGGCTTVLLSPGSDKCLWLTNQAHLDRLGAKLDRSPARESDVRDFRRLYYAQTVKAPLKDGRVAISDKLMHFAGLGQDVVLVGIDDHFEVWDAARWKRYTQEKKAAAEE